MSFFTFVVLFTMRSGQSTPVTFEQKSRHSAGSTRKNLATATACSLLIKSECCCDGLPFCTISTFAPVTAASTRDLICSNDSIVQSLNPEFTDGLWRSPITGQLL